MKLRGVNLILEITRWCNLQCSHCCRGKRQHKHMSIETIQKVLQQIEDIDTVTFTGGEPSLAVPQIEAFVDLCYRYGIRPHNFYIVTNAVRTTERFLDALRSLYRLCDDNEISGVAVSSDEFHGNPPCDHLERIEEVVSYELNDGRANKVYFEVRKAEQNNLISEGRAEENYWCARDADDDVEVQVNDWEDEPFFVYTGLIYINALGQVLLGCDYSYANQKKLWICTVNDDIASCIEQCPAVQNYIEEEDLSLPVRESELEKVAV